MHVLHVSALALLLTSACGGKTIPTGDASAVPTGTPPSCMSAAPGRTDCGAEMESCCTSPEVTGGTFSRTYKSTGHGPTNEGNPASVSSFRLDKYDVTVGRFRTFVTAVDAGYAPAPGSGKHTHLNGGKGLASVGEDGGLAYEPGWAASDGANLAPTSANLACDILEGGPGFATWTPDAGANENRPVNCTNWYEAYAFCIWDGGFLPSETEGEYAAVGGSDLREYPWGTTDPGMSYEYAVFECYYPNATTTNTGCENAGNVAPVGTAIRGAGLWGQLDLIGNMGQWELDYWYASDTGAAPVNQYFVNPCVDCAYLAATPSTSAYGSPQPQRVARGSAFVGPISDVSGGAPPLIRDATVGFRCARVP